MAQEGLVERMTERAYIVSRTLETKIAMAENNGNNALIVTIDMLKEILSLLKEQETTFIKDGHHIMCKSCGAYWCGMDREGDWYPQNFCPNCGRAGKCDG